MKKQISKLLLLIAALAAAFSLTACGFGKNAERSEDTKREGTSSEKKDEEEGSDEDAAGTETDQTEDETENESGNTNAFGRYDSMTDYVNSSEVQDVLSSLSSQMSGSGMKVEITAEGNKMVYTYTYESLTKEDGMAENLESAMTSQDATFQSTANSLKTVVKEANPSIEIRYVDSNGEVIYSKEYVAE